MDELIEKFSFDRVNQAPAIFDEKRLRSLQSAHLRALSDSELVRQLTGFNPTTDPQTVAAAVPLLRERITTFSDSAPLLAPILITPDWNQDVPFPPAAVAPELAAIVLQEALNAINDGMVADPVKLRTHLTAIVEQVGAKPRDAFRVLYLAILRQPAGLPVFDVMALIGAEATSNRLREALSHLPTPFPAAPA